KPSVAPESSTEIMSSPHEYDIDRISANSGKTIFEKTGIGDPYRTGIPYAFFLAMERAYPEIWGANWTQRSATFGFLDRTPDPASDDIDKRFGLPVGMHLTTDPLTGVEFLVTNCSLCHAERVRTTNGTQDVVYGLGNKRVRIHAYDAAFADVVTKPRFTATYLGALAAEAAEKHGLAWPEAYREVMVGATIDAMKKRAAERADLVARTRDNPPGRVATIESFAVALARLTNQPIAFANDVGWAKVPDVIGYAHRVTLSWDGSQEGPIDLLVVEADLAAGARVKWLEEHPFQGASLGAYLRAPAPRPAFPGAIDRALAAKGKQLFADTCEHCHGSYADDGHVEEYAEQVVPLADVHTDAARLLAPTESFERAANEPALTRGYTRFRRSTGYVPPVLTNVWARAPYGHAGQWPSLAFLATPPDRRAKQYVVDLGAPYDLATVGVALLPAGAPVPATGYAHDATKPGFSVDGHPFLADLGGDARAVIEYLKTL
ncbi:MAG: hypothetical protein AB7T06_46820, partial [Kofleriaceae bacterium]